MATANLTEVEEGLKRLLVGDKKDTEEDVKLEVGGTKEEEDDEDEEEADDSDEGEDGELDLNKLSAEDKQGIDSLNACFKKGSYTFTDPVNLEKKGSADFKKSMSGYTFAYQPDIDLLVVGRFPRVTYADGTFSTAHRNLLRTMCYAFWIHKDHSEFKDNIESFFFPEMLTDFETFFNAYVSRTAWIGGSIDLEGAFHFKSDTINNQYFENPNNLKRLSASLVGNFQYYHSGYKPGLALTGEGKNFDSAFVQVLSDRMQSISTHGLGVLEFRCEIALPIGLSPGKNFIMYLPNLSFAQFGKAGMTHIRTLVPKVKSKMFKKIDSTENSVYYDHHKELLKNACDG